jgi:hypothetical protein
MRDILGDIANVLFIPLAAIWLWRELQEIFPWLNNSSSGAPTIKDLSPYLDSQSMPGAPTDWQPPVPPPSAPPAAAITSYNRQVGRYSWRLGVVVPTNADPIILNTTPSPSSPRNDDEMR